MVLQLFNREARSRREFELVNREHMNAYKGAITAYGWFYPVVEFISMLALAGILSYGGYRVTAGRLTLGVVVAFLQYGLRFFRPIQDLSEKYNILQAAMASSERIFKLLDTSSELPVAGPPAAASGGHRPHRVPPRMVRVPKGRLGAGRRRASPSRRAKPWRWWATPGPARPLSSACCCAFTMSGAGPSEIGGTDLRDFDPLEFRRQFGVVLQDPYLFTGTLKDNIRLGTESITDREVETAAEQVNLLDFMRELPKGFAHPIAERGAGLSTGQKQLISFARALAHNPRFLILDEATSSVDTETELRVRAALDRMVEGRTSIVIAHRLSTIQRADRILVMHKGRLRESGTHQELLALRGIYWKLYQLQYKDQKAIEAVSGQRPAFSQDALADR